MMLLEFSMESHYFVANRTGIEMGKGVDEIYFYFSLTDFRERETSICRSTYVWHALIDPCIKPSALAC